MNYTVNANIYETVDVNYRKKDSKGVLLLSEYKKEQVKTYSYIIIRDTFKAPDPVIGKSS